MTATRNATMRTSLGDTECELMEHHEYYGGRVEIRDLNTSTSRQKKISGPVQNLWYDQRTSMNPDDATLAVDHLSTSRTQLSSRTRSVQDSADGKRTRTQSTTTTQKGWCSLNRDTMDADAEFKITNTRRGHTHGSKGTYVPMGLYGYISMYHGTLQFVLLEWLLHWATGVPSTAVDKAKMYIHN